MLERLHIQNYRVFNDLKIVASTSLPERTIPVRPVCETTWLEIRNWR